MRMFRGYFAAAALLAVCSATPALAAPVNTERVVTASPSDVDVAVTNYSFVSTERAAVQPRVGATGTYSGRGLQANTLPGVGLANLIDRRAPRYIDPG